MSVSSTLQPLFFARQQSVYFVYQFHQPMWILLHRGFATKFLPRSASSPCMIYSPRQACLYSRRANFRLYYFPVRVFGKLGDRPLFRGMIKQSKSCNSAIGIGATASLLSNLQLGEGITNWLRPQQSTFRLLRASATLACSKIIRPEARTLWLVKIAHFYNFK